MICSFTLHDSPINLIVYTKNDKDVCVFFPAHRNWQVHCISGKINSCFLYLLKIKTVLHLKIKNKRTGSHDAITSNDWKAAMYYVFVFRSPLNASEHTLHKPFTALRCGDAATKRKHVKLFQGRFQGIFKVGLHPKVELPCPHHHHLWTVFFFFFGGTWFSPPCNLLGHVTSLRRLRKHSQSTAGSWLWSRRESQSEAHS